MITNLFLIFISMFLAEVGDKTQLSMLLLSSKTKKHFLLLLGCMSAFAIVGLIPVLFGSFITKYISLQVIKIISGIVFIIVGIITLRKKQELEEVDKEKITLKNPYYTSLTIIFLAEMGDTTQVTMAIFSIKFNPLTVYTMSMFAFLFISFLTIYLGKFLFQRFNEKLIEKIAGGLFILIGIFFLIVK